MNKGLFSLVLVTVLTLGTSISYGQIKKNNKVKKGGVPIEAPRVKDYSFKSIPADTLIDGELELRYGDGYSWKEIYPDNDRRYRDPWADLRTGYRDFLDQLGQELNIIDLRMNGGFSQINVFTNKPDTHILNLRIKSTNSIPVSIAVVDLNGGLVAKEVIEEFDGDFIGQMALKENIKGVVFVIISQGENGVSRKVKIE